MGYEDATATTFRDTVRRERQHRGWTQTHLAQEMTKRGIPTNWPAINKIEAGTRNVTISEAAAIANAFGITVTRLIGGKTRPAADRDFALRHLQEAVADAHRTTRTAARDITSSLTALAEITNTTDIVTATQKTTEQLDQTALQLARLGGTLAETRGNHEKHL